MDRSTITLTAYTVEATGKTGYRAATPLGEYCLHDHTDSGSGWFAIQLFGAVGCVAGKGSDPYSAIEAALDAGRDPVTVIRAGDSSRESGAQISSELTPHGEQFVIPGAERDRRRGPIQMGLW